MDIRFYGKDFKLRHILPGYSENKTAISTNMRLDFNGDGYFELDFKDEELESLVVSDPELLVICGKFQGFLTGYNFTGTKKKLFGMHLNGLLAREVVDDTTEPTSSSDVETILYDRISKMQADGRLSWLTVKPAKNCFTAAVDFYKGTCVKANTWVQELLAMDNAGYKISADIKNCAFYIEVLRRTKNNLIVSESLDNAYDITVDYNRRSYANGGFYRTDDGEWKYMQLDSSVSGLDRADTVLNASTEAEALRELEAAAITSTVTALIKRLSFGADYTLGDIVRLQTKYGTVQKEIASVLISSEGIKYIENPELKEVVK